jgi:HEAT repeat protein
MKPIGTFVALFWSLAFAAAPPADKSDLPAVDPVQTAFNKLVRAYTNKDWPSEIAARTELASLAQAAVPKVTEAARSHGEARVRLACYELLTSAFAKDERAIDTVVQYGLNDQDHGIRYSCAFLLGDLKVHHAEPALRAALKGATGKDDEFLRCTLSKSLAQLGEADVLPTLFAAVSNDSFMFRHVGNIGLEGLSGKNLEDFEGYHYGEGAIVIGGIEALTPGDAITSAEKKAQRFQAATAYFKWLKSERPELYMYVTYRRPEQPLGDGCIDRY